MNKNACCFLGHRKIKITNVLKEKLHSTLKMLITNEKIDTFLFGSKSQFDCLCHQIVTALKADYPHIKRIYVRAEFPYIDADYKSYLLQNYEDSYYPYQMGNAGKAVYVERNCKMIDESRLCVVYFDKNYAPAKRKRKKTDSFEYQPKSGTKIAYEYALKKQKTIINIHDEIR